MVCCQRQEEPKGELCCFAGLSVPVLGQSAGRGCLISHRNYTGALPRVGWPCTVWQQGTTEPLDVPKGRMVPAAGSSWKVSAGWYLCACPTGRMCWWWEGEAAPPEGDSSSLAPPLCVGARERTLPLGKQHLSHTPAGYAHPQCWSQWSPAWKHKNSAGARGFLYLQSCMW